MTKYLFYSFAIGLLLLLVSTSPAGAQYCVGTVLSCEGIWELNSCGGVEYPEGELCSADGDCMGIYKTCDPVFWCDGPMECVVPPKVPEVVQPLPVLMVKSSTLPAHHTTGAPYPLKTDH